MTVAHSTLTGTDLHENKGAAAAADDTVATVTSGATVWKKLTAANLGPTANAFGGALLHVREEQPSGTAYLVPVTYAWATRILNTVKTNEITSSSLSTNQISLPAGTYFIEATSCAYNSVHKARLRNITDSTTTIVGTSEVGAVGYGAQTRSLVNGRFTLTGTKTLELQYYATNASALSYPTASGEVEVNAEVLIWKVA